MSRWRKRSGRRARRAEGADHPPRGPGVRPARAADRGRWPAAVPAVRASAERRRAHLPTAERAPRRCLTGSRVRPGAGRPALAGARAPSAATGPQRPRQTATVPVRDQYPGTRRPCSCWSRAAWRSWAGWSRRPTRPGTARSARVTTRPRASTSRSRGAPAMGLPDRDAGRAGGRRLRRLPRGELGRGAADGDARRALRPGHVPALDRHRPAGGPDRARAPRRPRRPA